MDPGRPADGETKRAGVHYPETLTSASDTKVSTSVENLDLAAGGGSGFWPTGVVMLVVISVIAVLTGIRRSHNAKKGTGGPGE